MTPGWQVICYAAAFAAFVLAAVVCVLRLPRAWWPALLSLGLALLTLVSLWNANAIYD